MTLVKIIGEEPQKKVKPIEFIEILGNRLNPGSKPSDWNNIELIAFNYSNGLDLMFAYNEHRSCGVAYLGHFNDGIV